MTVTKKRASLPKMLAILTGLFVLAQVLLLMINVSTTKFFDTAVSSSLTSQILHSSIFVTGLLRFLASQLLIYTLFVGLIWYLAISVGELFSLRYITTYMLGIALLFISFIAILSANYRFIPHSFFSNLIRTQLANPLLDTPIRYAFFLSSWILVTTACLAISKIACATSRF
jgi:hypothetical protein